MENTIKDTILIITIIILGFFLIKFSDYHANWYFHADQELTLLYNALIINSGFSQEYNDHPGVLTIFLLSKFLQTINYLGINNYTDILKVNSNIPLFEGLSEGIYYTRIFAAISVLITTVFIYILFKFNNYSREISFLIAIAFFTSNGVFYHFTQLRTEFITYVCILVFIYSYVKYQNLGKIIYLLISLFFLNLAIVNKAQVIAFAPLYLIWSFIFINKNKATIVNNKYDKFYILIFFVTLILFLNKTLETSLLFNVFYFIILLSIFFYHAKITSKNIFYAGSLFSFFYLATKLILRYICEFYSIECSFIFYRIENPLSMTQFFHGDGKVVHSLLYDFSLINLTALIKIYHFLSDPILKYFSLGRFNSITIYLIFILLSLFYIKSLKIRNSIILSLICFYLVNLINNLRGIGLYYNIFCEIFLMGCVLIIINGLDFKRTKLIIILSLITLIMIVNLILRNRYQNNLNHMGLDGGGLKEICINFPHESYHKKINLHQFYIECDQNMIR